MRGSEFSHFVRPMSTTNIIIEESTIRRILTMSESSFRCFRGMA